MDKGGSRGSKTDHCVVIAQVMQRAWNSRSACTALFAHVTFLATAGKHWEPRSHSYEDVRSSHDGATPPTIPPILHDVCIKAAEQCVQVVRAHVGKKGEPAASFFPSPGNLAGQIAKRAGRQAALHLARHLFGQLLREDRQVGPAPGECKH
eukprot:scaffold181817_cov16-Tisochrysis_lutea.AAC.1